MQEKYKKLVRQVYRYLRHPKRRGSGLAGWVATRVFDRRLWRLDERGFALGLAFGVVAALLPIPGQMFVAAALCIWKKANIPLAILGCWTTPPMTPFLVILPIQIGVGHWILSSLGLPTAKINLLNVLNLNAESPNFLKFKENVTLTLKEAIFIAQEAILGVAVTISLGGLITYWLAKLIWITFLGKLVDKLIHHKRTTPGD